ncbi:MAG TPA: hypothetical protein VGS19_11425 [Streptosporangiaceae bacterium]|nr:hypothetical protein [Streptosporangiaceae bacterium]
MGFLSWLTAKVEFTKSPEEPGWLRRWVVPGPGRADPKFEKIKEAAAEDVAEVEAGDGGHFREYESEEDEL